MGRRQSLRQEDVLCAREAPFCRKGARLWLDLGYAGGDEADKDKVLAAAVHELMFLIAGDEKYGAAGDFPPFAVLVNLAPAGVNEYFMFPGVGMAGGEAPGGNGEDTHAKVFGTVRLADDDPAGYAFYRFVVEPLCRTLFIVCNFHRIFLGEVGSFICVADHENNNKTKSEECNV
jgi:hypothetical protein